MSILGGLILCVTHHIKVCSYIIIPQPVAKHYDVLLKITSISECYDKNAASGPVNRCFLMFWVKMYKNCLFLKKLSILL